MNVQLLDKTRKLTKMLHNANSGSISFSEISHVLSGVLDSEIVILKENGKILSKCLSEQAVSLREFTDTEEETINSSLNERLLGVLSTQENVNLETLGIEGCGNQAMIAPVIIAGERLATLVAYRKSAPYDIDSIILVEYGAVITGMELVHEQNIAEERATGKEENIQSAVRVMSSSEREAAWYVLNEMKGEDGILVASRLAQKEHLTRSVIVNTLRKMESSGVLVSRSSGMKGTYVHFLNPALLQLMETELEKDRKKGFEKRVKNT